MQLITDQEIMLDHGKPMVIALGSFDGVHKGHRKIINETVYLAREMDALSGVFTFYPHPLKVLAPMQAPKLIQALPQKMRLLDELGIDRLILKTFTQEFASTDFQSFVEVYLVRYLKVKGIVVGEDFRFGKGSQGNVHRLKELGAYYNFFVTVFDTIRVNDVEVRSTLIRQMISAGKMEELITFLGHPYTLSGTVIHGDGRGRHLGFPTANVSLGEDYLIPPYGVYAVNIRVQDAKYPAIANIGVRPTFHKSDLSVEIHILDYYDDIYGEQVEVEVIKMIRPERNFASVDELIEQVQKDTETARIILQYNES